MNDCPNVDDWTIYGHNDFEYYNEPRVDDRTVGGHNDFEYHNEPWLGAEGIDDHNDSHSWQKNCLSYIIWSSEDGQSYTKSTSALNPNAAPFIQRKNKCIGWNVNAPCFVPAGCSQRKFHCSQSSGEVVECVVGQSGDSRGEGYMINEGMGVKESNACQLSGC